MRTPLPRVIARNDKRAAGRTGPEQTPLELRAGGVRISDRLDAYARERAGRKLGKFASYVERVAVRFEDVNGPRGGVDAECRVRIIMSRGPDIVVRQRGTAPRDAFDLAIDAAERALRRTLESRGRSTGKKSRSARAAKRAARGLSQ